MTLVKETYRSCTAAGRPCFNQSLFWKKIETKCFTIGSGSILNSLRLSCLRDIRHT